MENIDFRWLESRLNEFKSSKEDRLISYSQNIDGMSLENFLWYFPDKSKFLWINENENINFAGVEKSVELKVKGPKRYDKMQKKIKNLFDRSIIKSIKGIPEIGPRLFGGFSFIDQEHYFGMWLSFSSSHFILPKLQLTKYQNKFWLTINVVLSLKKSPKDHISDIKHLLSNIGKSTKQANIDETKLLIRNLTSQDQWIKIIQKAKAKIKNKEIQKVVVSRICQVDIKNQKIDIIKIISNLIMNYPNCFIFIFEPEINNLYFGASPEILAKVKGNMFYTVAVAGSNHRGNSLQEDNILGTQLLNDPKEKLEHKIVVDQIIDRINPITSNIMISSTGLLKLRNIQHLKTNIKSNVEKSKGIINVIKRLHPTPAVGGKPKEQALKLIADLEQEPRGWYASPIGWVDHSGDGVFAVGIRSAICNKETIWLYAGAGIVENSNPRKEWEETKLKFKPIADALGIDN